MSVMSVCGKCQWQSSQKIVAKLIVGECILHDEVDRETESEEERDLLS